MAMAAATILLCLAFLLPSLNPTEAHIGVCYGMLGNNLPSPKDLVKLYKSNGIGAMRIYSPEQAILHAVQGSGIELILDIPNSSLQPLGSNSSAAMKWVQTYVLPFAPSIKYIAVGNEVDPSDDEAPYVLPVMKNILNALNSIKLGGQIKVSTAIYTSFLIKSYPPSSGKFTNKLSMGPIVNFLKSNGSPLLVNVNLYSAYIDNVPNIDINYTLFTSPGAIFTDSDNGLQYQNLFDAIVDSAYAALAEAGAPDTTIVVSETGWPSDGGDAAMVDNAGTYYKNLINHVKQGTPLKKQGIETYLRSMFDEDQKDVLTDQNFGLFTPSQQPKYLFRFN